MRTTKLVLCANIPLYLELEPLGQRPFSEVACLTAKQWVPAYQPSSGPPPPETHLYTLAFSLAHQTNVSDSIAFCFSSFPKRVLITFLWGTWPVSSKVWLRAPVWRCVCSESATVPFGNYFQWPFTDCQPTFRAQYKTLSGEVCYRRCDLSFGCPRLKAVGVHGADAHYSKMSPWNVNIINSQHVLSIMHQVYSVR